MTASIRSQLSSCPWLWALQGPERKRTLLNNFLQMGIYIMSSKIFHGAFIITSHVWSGSPSHISLSVISDLHHISLRNWNQKLISYVKSRGSGFKNLWPHKSLRLMLLHIIQFGFQGIIYDLFSLGTVLLLRNLFLLSKQCLPDKLQLHKITQASEMELTGISCCSEHLPPQPPMVVKYEVH